MESEIQTIAVIGAGQRGRMISRAALLAGYRTVLEDVSPQTLSDAIAWMRSAPSEATPMENLGTVSSVEAAVREADLVIEAAAEEMEVKIELFTIFDKFAKPNAILASSSPTLPVTEMASVTFCADRCVGMRFLGASPFQTITLVVTPVTSDDTVARCEAVARRLRHTVAVMRESGDQGSDSPPLKSAAANH